MTWHYEHTLINNCFPYSIIELRYAAEIGLLVAAPATENVVPIDNKARTNRSGATERCLRN